MEEVWKDINLASLHDNHSSDPNPNFILQDFFARPFNKDPPKRLVSTTTKNAAVTAAAPATVLSLNSIPAYTQQLENTVKELEQENARLRSQLEELYLAAAAQLPKKHMLHRTSTAPF
ncbi:hypothetical protein JCGZ_25359 [Jatropha curcas]|uniref:Uncharacterized protein n=1 Tax=Jatropha curcas TaxID=180498 RepID=A0A067JJ22_JATCU|nr:hypothetical protein JCGZ_25359 [Jatropha curcas]